MIDKTKEELIEELNELRRRVAEREKFDLIRRQIEKRVQESEKKYRTLFENATDAIYLIDPETQKILDCNPKASEITGYTIKELSSLTVVDVHPVEEQDIVSKIFRKIAGKGSLSGISGINHLRKDETIVPVEVNASTIDLEGRRCTLAIIRDITARKNSEEELKKREEKYHTLFKHMSIGCALHKIIVDKHNQPVDYVFIETNEAFERITGLNRKHIKGKKATEIIPGIKKAKPDLISIYGKVALAGEEAKFELQYGPLDKWYAVSSYSPMKAHFVTLFDDITERRQHEEALVRSEEKQRLLINNFANPITVYDLKGVILLINNTGAKMLGGKPDDFIGKRLSDINPGLADTLVKKNRRILKSKKGGEFENIVRLPSGKERWFLSNLQPIKDKSGRIYAVQSIAHDITKRKQAEEALARSKVEFEAMFNSIPDAAIYTDTDCCIVMTNPAVKKIFGYSQQDLQGTPPDVLYAAGSGYEEKGRQRFNSDSDSRLEPYEVMYCRKNGSIFVGETLVSKVVDSGGETIGFIGIIRDISKRKEIEQQLQAAAITDDLTGLFNRRGFLTLSEQQRKIADRTGRLMSLLYLDLDGMKAINDELGHKEGDQALVDTANILKRTLRESDIIGRIGGDEFAVFLTYISEPNVQHVIINHIQENLRIHNQKAGRNYELFLSIGIAYYNPKYPCSINELLTRSDHLMYKNKKHKSEKEILKSLREKRIEKRAFERFQSTGNYRAKLNGSDKFRIKNISSGGLCLKTPKRFSVDTHYKIRMPAPDNKEIKSSAIVVWSTQLKTEIPKNDNCPYYETGLKFVDLSDSQKSSLQIFINNFTE